MAIRHHPMRATAFFTRMAGLSRGYVRLGDEAVCVAGRARAKPMTDRVAIYGYGAVGNRCGVRIEHIDRLPKRMSRLVRLAPAACKLTGLPDKVPRPGRPDAGVIRDAFRPHEILIPETNAGRAAFIANW